MNILVSWKWLGEWVDLQGLTPEAVAARVSLSGPGIEKIIPLDTHLAGIVVGHVKTVEPHPKADRLRVAMVDIGSETLTIVCGGSNLKADQWVAVAKLGSWVRWHGEGEPIELKPTEIRGVKSEGMICAASEIGLGEAFPHEEKAIMDLAEEIPWMKTKFAPGVALARLLEIDGDVAFDAEVTTNRPDAMGIVGFSREVAAILGRTHRPAMVKESSGKEPSLPVQLLPAKKGKRVPCPRFCAIRIDGVDNTGRTPWFIRQRLMTTGIRSVNPVVDITNYLLLEYGHPLHAYDAAKLNGDLAVDFAKQGEPFAALNGKTYALQSSMLTVRDVSGPVAIAGVMGGEATAVTKETTAIVLEAAVFDEVSIRRTSRALDLMTDASKLFERGLSVEAPRQALARAVELCLEGVLGPNAVVTTQFTDERTIPQKAAVYSLSEKDACRLMGVSLSGDEMQGILERLGFLVERAKAKLKVTVPWWRDHDIEDARDLVEEIARVYGYTNMSPVFPAGVSPVPSDPSFAFESRLRDLSKGFGFTELMGYSFVSREQLERVNMNMDLCVHLANPLSQEAEYMRPSLGISILQAIVDNQERASELRLFELSNVYWKQPEAGVLPIERSEFVMAIATKNTEPWAEAKGLAETFLLELGITRGNWSRWEGDHFWHPGRTLRYIVDGKPLFTVGELHPHMAEQWKIDRRVGLLQVFPMDLQACLAQTKAYHPIPSFPEIVRDLAVDVEEPIEIATVSTAIKGVDTQGLLKQVSWFETYRGQGLPEGKKSLAFHLVFRAHDRTLASEEVDTLIANVRMGLEKEIGASFRG